MSRHRDFRNLNINGKVAAIDVFVISNLTIDELDDDALSDGGEEDMTDEQHGITSTWHQADCF